MATLKLPLLADIRFGSAGQHGLIFGPAIARAWGSGTDRNSGYSIGAVLAGGTVGLSLANGPDFRIFPEIAVYTTVAGHGIGLPGAVVRVPPDVGGGQPVFLQAGIGFSFGRTR